MSSKTRTKTTGVLDFSKNEEEKKEEGIRRTQDECLGQHTGQDNRIFTTVSGFLGPVRGVDEADNEIGKGTNGVGSEAILEFNNGIVVLSIKIWTSLTK